MSDEEFINDLVTHFAKMILDYEEVRGYKLTFDIEAEMLDGRMMLVHMGKIKDE